MSRLTTGAANGIVSAAAVAGVLVALVNYLTPDNGIARTPGALLVVASTALLLLVGVALRRQKSQEGAWRSAMLAMVAILIAGTAWASWLLEAPTLVALMALAATAWMLGLVRRN